MRWRIARRRGLTIDASSFAWRPDNRRVVFGAIRGTNTYLYEVDLATRKVDQLTFGSGGSAAASVSTEDRLVYSWGPMQPEWSPDGKRIVFLSTRQGNVSKLFVANADGLPRAIGEPEHVVRAERAWHVHNGGWSADSKRLVYTQDRDYGDIYELVKQEQAP